MVAAIETVNLTQHDTPETMVSVLTETISVRLNAAIEKRGSALMAVSGGSSPKPLYQALSEVDLAWDKVTVLLVDERWVDPGAPGSNEDFIQSHLLQKNAKNAHFIGLKTAGDTPADGLDEALARVEGLNWPLDVCVLGLGPDGHTASWFPDAQGLDTALDPDAKRLAAVTAHKSEVTGEHVERITLTRAALTDCGLSLLMIQGAAKREAFDIAAGPGDIAEMPVRALLRDPDFDLAVHWAP